MILEKIRQIYPQLTKSQRRLADFIATSYQEAAFMTASRLARRLDLNEATVIRFAQRLGYPGYPELIQDVQDIVQRELGTKDTPETVVEDPFVARLHAEIDNLHRAVSHISPATTHQAIDMLSEAQRIYVLGQGIASSLAQLLSISLKGLGLEAETPPADVLGLALALGDIDAASLVIGISVLPESEEVANALRYARHRGARTLALTSSPISPSAQAAELALACVVGESFSPSCITATALVIDALVQRVAAQATAPDGDRALRLAEARRFILHGSGVE
jgi:DNA-binding MurR/RpiR family transcriptional regulator